ncbi:hypothetical protein ACO34A_09845 [Rhizobium sp. ACO-34A]|nr:hypothetical protein [Rhizobium sp. ACO-34A]ATN34107.1 hypothetical protein ACO34A_09845 [Rhizobium sp. ACO-34A]
MLARTSWLTDVSVSAIDMKRRRAQRYGGLVTTSEYRGKGASTLYQPPAPKYEPLVGEQQRKRLVAWVSAFLRQWRSSPWEYEADARKTLRDYFVRQGYRWAQSDLEAAKITAAALKAIGASVRPSWEDGQPESLRVLEKCLQCGADIRSRPGVAASVFFCAPIPGRIPCETRYNRHRHEAFKPSLMKEAAALYLDAFRDRLPRRDCPNCKKSFRPNFTDMRFCSRGCSNAAGARGLSPCQHCDTPFKPRLRNGKLSRFCSKTCAGLAKTLTVDLTCRHCGTGFTGQSDRLYCGRDCYQAARAFICSPQT